MAAANADLATADSLALAREARCLVKVAVDGGEVGICVFVDCFFFVDIYCLKGRVLFVFVRKPLF